MITSTTTKSTIKLTKIKQMKMKSMSDKNAY